MVENSDGERLYTRNGVFKTNADNELVNLTGQRVLGYGIDDSYQLQKTTLVPLTIPLGSAATAQPTKNVYLQGTLTPSGDVADTAGVIQSAVLGDSSLPRPDASGATGALAPTPSSAGTTTGSADTGGSLNENTTYQYAFTFTDSSGHESLPSNAIAVNVPVGNAANDDTITLTGVPNLPAGYTGVNVYRTGPGGSSFGLVGTATPGGSFVDTGAVAPGAPLDASSLDGNYSYVVTYFKAGEQESRPSLLIGPQNVVNGRIQLDNLPPPPVPGPGDNFPAYDTIRIYRNLASDSSSFYLVGQVTPGQSFTDSASDASISNLATPGNAALGFDGPEMDSNTLLVNVVKRDGLDYEPLFQPGTLEFSPTKGGRSLGTKEFEITATTTVQDLLDFMQAATGIQTSVDDPLNPVPGSVNNIQGESGTLGPGLVIKDGQLRVVSNNGVDNAVDINLSSFRIRTPTGDILTPNLAFNSVQDAKGQSAVSDFIAYDTLGIPLNVRVTAVLQGVTDSSTTYRWFAESPDNSPLTGSAISVGTGLITFDGNGNLIGTSNNTVTVERRNIPSSDPLEFKLDFSQVTGLATDKSSLAASRQDGSPAGTLSSFIIGEDGIIRGVFSSGVTRDLGALRLSRFANPAGLVQRGQNLFSQGVNSGLPIEGDPNTQGLGSIVAGAVELSNTDIGKNLIDLVLATTQYRGNARVISTAQQMLDELLNLRR
jgi:flagellar hook protein FlgE